MKLPTHDVRDMLLRDLRNKKMARSPSAYVRGNTVQFYEWLHGRTGHALPVGPPVWICGDCHLGNLGPLGDADGHVDLEIRDLDQTHIGNPAHDLIRLGLSLVMAARGAHLPGVVTAHMLEHMVQGYGLAFDARVDSASIERPKAVRWVMRKALARSWKHLAKERIANTRPTIPLGKKFWPLSRDEKSGIVELFSNPDVLKLLTTLKSRSNDARVQVMDAAFWVKGCSSLGLLRYAVLLGVNDKKNNEYCLIDIKQAVNSVAPGENRFKMPRDNALRVLEGARQLAPALGQRMAVQKILGRGVFLRELLPQDLKLEIDQLPLQDSANVARYLAYVVGRAHARQMDDTSRARWHTELKLDRSKTFSAPTWLWDSVVQLVADHEAGYLEHCRKYALPQGAR